VNNIIETDRGIVVNRRGSKLLGDQSNKSMVMSSVSLISSLIHDKALTALLAV
jgi:hypothetical protein